MTREELREDRTPAPARPPLLDADGWVTEDRRRTNGRSRARKPLGTETWRSERRADGTLVRVCWVKVAQGMRPSAANWKRRSRLRWEEAHGPVPAGMRVVAKDLCPAHDELSNLTLMSAADVVATWALAVPGRGEEQLRRAHAGAARHNVLRGRLRKKGEILPSLWYALDPERRIVQGDGAPSRWRLLQTSKLPGVRRCRSGGGWLAAVLGWPQFAQGPAALAAALYEAQAPMGAVQLAAAANALRARHGLAAPLKAGTVHSGLVPLRAAGLIVTLWPGRGKGQGRGRARALYAASAAMRAQGRPAWHLVCRRGEDLEGPAWSRAKQIERTGALKGLRTPKGQEGRREFVCRLTRR